jgi:formylmethanofuran dehydrogenase subunit B
MEDYKVVSVDDALKAKAIEKGERVPKLSPEESEEYVKAHIDDNVRYRLLDFFPSANKKEDGFAITVDFQKGCGTYGANDEQIEDLTKRSHIDLVRNWKYDPMLLNACRSVKLDKEYVRVIIKSIHDEIKAHSAIGKSFVIYKAHFQEGKTLLRK